MKHGNKKISICVVFVVKNVYLFILPRMHLLAVQRHSLRFCLGNHRKSPGGLRQIRQTCNPSLSGANLIPKYHPTHYLLSAHKAYTGMGNNPLLFDAVIFLTICEFNFYPSKFDKKNNKKISICGCFCVLWYIYRIGSS